MSDLVTVKVSTYPTELTIAKTYLEDNDVFCFIKDELINQVYPMSTSTFGGAKLQVWEEDAEKARVLLVEGGFAKKEDYEPTKTEEQLVKIVEKIESVFGRKKK